MSARRTQSANTLCDSDLYQRGHSHLRSDYHEYGVQGIHKHDQVLPVVYLGVKHRQMHWQFPQQSHAQGGHETPKVLGGKKHLGQQQHAQLEVVQVLPWPVHHAVAACDNASVDVLGHQEAITASRAPQGQYGVSISKTNVFCDKMEHFTRLEKATIFKCLASFVVKDK